MNILGGAIGDSDLVELAPIGTLTSANLRYNFIGNFDIGSGATLRVAPGADVLIQDSVNIIVDGTFEVDNAASFIIVDGDDFNGTASGITVRFGGIMSSHRTSFSRSFSGDQRDITDILIQDGGQLVAIESLFAWERIDLRTGSTSIVTQSVVNSELVISGGSDIGFQGNSLIGSIVAGGPNSEIIDLNCNFWGTTNLDVIENRILHQADEANRALVLYEDILTNPGSLPGVEIDRTSLTVTEDGGSDGFAVRLESRPLADVVIEFTSLEQTEGTVSPASLTFTPDNWDQFQPVVVTGVDDGIVDGDVTFTIATSSTSDDGCYQRVDPVDITVVNEDNDQPSDGDPNGVIVRMLSNGDLEILGSLNNDMIVLSGGTTAEPQVRVRANGADIGSFDVTGVVRVLGSDGADSVNAGALELVAVTGSLGNGNDFFNGGSAGDSIEGGEGSDTLNGRGGDDTLEGDDGADVINGHDGNDSIDGGAGDDLLVGSSGNDEIIGGPGNDEGFGGSARDTLHGNGGRDSLVGNGSRDLIFGDRGNDSLDGGQGEDTIEGGDGNDILGGQGDGDELFGNEGNDTLLGGFGNDLLQGGLGNDRLDGGNTRDTLRGGVGNDVLLGRQGQDLLEGNDGDDTLDGGTDTDSLNGGGGADIFRVRGLGDEGLQFTIANNPSGDPIVRISRVDSTVLEVERIQGFDVFDAILLETLGGNDTINLEAGVALGGTIRGGDGFDRFIPEDEEDRDKWTLNGVEG